MTHVVAQISPVTLPLAVAQSLTDVAVAGAVALGIPYTITVVDGGAHVVQVTRMDGAVLASIEHSLAKARTAVHFGAATADLGLPAAGRPSGPPASAAGGVAPAIPAGEGPGVAPAFPAGGGPGVAPAFPAGGGPVVGGAAPAFPAGVWPAVMGTANGPLTLLAGGVPVKDAAGVVIGAIGTAGGSPDQDHDLAAAATGAL